AEARAMRPNASASPGRPRCISQADGTTVARPGQVPGTEGHRTRCGFAFQWPSGQPRSGGRLPPGRTGAVSRPLRSEASLLGRSRGSWADSVVVRQGGDRFDVDRRAEVSREVVEEWRRGELAERLRALSRDDQHLAV